MYPYEERRCSEQIWIRSILHPIVCTTFPNGRDGLVDETKLGLDFDYYLKWLCRRQNHKQLCDLM